MTDLVVSVTHSAPTNIACIKYWGKASIALNTPINSSVSVTLDQDDLKALTTVTLSPAFEEDALWLNGSREDVARNKRVLTVLAEMRRRAGGRAAAAPDGSAVHVPGAALAGWRARIVSRNTFPTAAGLASSAAGYACLVHALADALGVVEAFPGELSTVARQGSGSACRSLYGGFVAWRAGAPGGDGADSLAEQVADERHWPELVVLVAVVSDKKKDTGSTDGMTRSVETSSLLAHRAAAVVPPRLAAIEAAYRARDFSAFARLTMADSNSFHAVCADTYPPVFYMNDVSRRIVALVHRLNGEPGHGGPPPAGGAPRVVAGYTFDAGPNAVIFTTRDAAAGVLKALLLHFPPEERAGAGGEPFVGSPALAAAAAAAELPPGGALLPGAPPPVPGAVRHVYVTRVGDGPRTLGADAALAHARTGLPLDTSAAEGVDKAL